jgi:predicted GTPase
MVRRVVIMGAAGRDFHNFNTVFRDNEDYCVIAFTAAQIPDIEDRRYPGVLAGALYPAGVPIYAEDDLADIIEGEHIDVVVFSYSDVSYQYVMHRSALVNAAGADFWLLGPKETMLKSEKPVVAVCAVRTGSGKSQTTRRVADILTEAGKRVVVVRHPMPYGDLAAQEVQRFAEYEDMDEHDCTIEEREEYEPHIRLGIVVYAGVDYEKILRRAEAEADFVVWDGGNNDLPFYVPDLHITVVDPHRPGHELEYYPGEANLLMADALVINKMGTAEESGITQVKANIEKFNPTATVVEANSPITVSESDAIDGKRVLVVEDGPTVTHGGMRYGAAYVAAERFGAAEMIDPRPYLVGSLVETFEEYPGIGTLLPAMGYGDEQVGDLEATINNTPCDVVVSGTPIDLAKLVDVDKPIVRVRYELEARGKPDLEDVLVGKFPELR